MRSYCLKCKKKYRKHESSYQNVPYVVVKNEDLLKNK